MHKKKTERILTIVFFVCMGFFCLQPIAHAQTLSYDVQKGEYKRKDNQRVYLVGQVVNIAGALQHRPGGADSQDSLFSKGRQGLMTSGGAIWTFVDNIKGQDLQWNEDYLGKFVKVHGWVFHDAQYVEVDTFKIDGEKFVWSVETNSFVVEKE